MLNWESVKDRTAYEQRVEIRGADSRTLLNLYAKEYVEFCPIDDERCDFFAMVERELMARLDGFSEVCGIIDVKRKAH